VGAVVLSGSALIGDVDPAYFRLAGSRAWLALSDEMFASGDARAAIACAGEGLAELGGDYSLPGMRDDTEQKLAAAGDLIRGGCVDDGARLMQRMLMARIEMYAAKCGAKCGAKYGP
jgi:hypothetical protein